MEKLNLDNIADILKEDEIIANNYFINLNLDENNVIVYYNNLIEAHDTLMKIEGFKKKSYDRYKEKKLLFIIRRDIYNELLKKDIENLKNIIKDLFIEKGIKTDDNKFLGNLKFRVDFKNRHFIDAESGIYIENKIRIPVIKGFGNSYTEAREMFIREIKKSFR